MIVNHQDIIQYSKPGPRYTSYPTQPIWNSNVGSKDLCKAIEESHFSEISLYVHLPFCESLCHFCACNRTIDPLRKLEQPYLSALFKEIETLARSFKTIPRLAQMHWGGGTPTFFKSEELESIHRTISQYFSFSNDAEMSVEIHPHVTSLEQLSTLRSLGFNRISMGVQDFDPKVQNKINRFQTYEETEAMFIKSRELGFSGCNIDLIYGLPCQTTETMEFTIDKVSCLKPDRIALYSFARVPWKEPFQRRFNDEDLPEGVDKVALYIRAKTLLIELGYEAIAMDHFALPHDELAMASHERKLHRNFMGYTTRGDLPILGMGVSAISDLKNLYTQNEKNLSRYIESASRDGFSVALGHHLSQDDMIRKDTILKLMCEFEISYEVFFSRWKLEFISYFSREMKELERMVQDGLLIKTEKKLCVSDRGQVLLRNIAMVFDAYLDPTMREKYSNTI